MDSEVARRRLLDAIRAVPRGQVASYGGIAARAGLPGRARMTAWALRTNDDPDLPWHRIVRADGRIAMPEGDRWHREQVRRLRAEGVTVERGRVRMPAGRSLDELLWSPP